METVNVSMRLLCKMGYSVKEVLVMLLIISCGRIAYSQGTVSFSNAGPGVNAPVYESDGVTKVSGPLFMAELLAGALADNISPVASTAFGTGNSAGYFFAGTQTVSGVLPGTTAWVQVDVWNTASGASFSQAQSSGLPNSWWQSSVFSVETGGVPTGTGPTPPARPFTAFPQRS